MRPPNTDPKRISDSTAQGGQGRTVNFSRRLCSLDHWYQSEVCVLKHHRCFDLIVQYFTEVITFTLFVENLCYSL